MEGRVMEQVEIKKTKNKNSLYAKEHKVAFLFVLLPVLGFILFSLIPLGYSVYAAFTDWNGLGQMNFIGLENFQKLFRDEYFYKTMFNTVFLMLGIPIGLILSFMLASALSRGIKGTT
ncbi:sugar ABC transporter permease, partial [Listeria monocytogenes]|nr:sugar ABC transporter permease [Listeria monocytogenes]